MIADGKNVIYKLDCVWNVVILSILFCLIAIKYNNCIICVFYNQSIA